MYALLSWHALFSRHSVVTFFSTLGDQFLLSMHATSGQQAGNLRTRSKTLGDPWKPSETLGKPSATVGDRWKPSLWQMFYTCSSPVTVFLRVFFIKLVKFGRTEVSIPPIDAKFQDLSIQRVVKGWFLIFGGEKSIFHLFFGRIFEEKKTFSLRNRSGRGFMSSRLGGIIA